MKTIFFTTGLLFLTLLTACDNEDSKEPAYDPSYPVCGTENASENLPWLKSLIENDKKGLWNVYTAEHEGADYILIYYFSSSSMLLDVYDCMGNQQDTVIGLSDLPEDAICIYSTVKEPNK